MEKILNFCKVAGKRVEKFEGERKYIATGDVIDNKIKSYELVSFENKPSRANQEVKVGDVLFAKMKDTVKVIQIDEENVNNIYSTGFFVITPMENVKSRYLYWLFNSKKFNEEKNNNCKGATQKALNLDNLSKIYINKFPTYEKQEPIINRLDKIQDIIDLRKKQIEQLDKLIKSQFVEMFGNLKKNDKNWEYVDEIGEVCVLNPKKSEVANINNIEVSFIPMQAVSEKGDINTSEIRLLNDVKSGFSYFIENDVLFAKITPCMENGKGAIAKGLKNKIGFGSTEFHVLRPKEKIKSVWLYTLTTLDYFRKEAEMKMTGSAGQKRVPTKFFEDYKIGIPPINLQNKFANFVEQINKQKSMLEKSLKETEELQENLMNKYFN